MNTLKLSLSVVANEDDSECATSVVRVATECIIDNLVVDITQRYFFDLARILAVGLHNANHVYPFTCGCGVAGCAGVHEPARIRTTARTVIWYFPADPFGEHLNPAFVSQTGQIRFVFNRQEYRQELERVTAELESLSKQAGLPVDIWSYRDMGEIGNAGRWDQFRQTIEDSRTELLKYNRYLDWREKTWGTLLTQELLISLPNGFSYSLPLENLTNLVAGDETSRYPSSARKKVVKTIADQFKQGHSAIFNIVRTLDWQELQPNLFHDWRTPEDLEPGTYAEQENWPEVQLSVVERGY